jgi:pSer/pThr/pTyr-binding forkhead associated (FHA) protein
MPVCPHCGHDTSDSAARFCPACGRPLAEAATETTSVLHLGESEPPETSEAPAPDAAEAGVVERLPLGAALLVVRRGPAAGARFLLDTDTTSAGRHPDSDIFLDDITVSRHHAEFRRESDGFHLRDLGSLNGTYVNRSRIDDTTLVSGDEVQIGKYRLLFLAGGDTAEGEA